MRKLPFLIAAIICFVLFGLTLNYGWGANQVDFPDIYIDAGAGDGGVGSEADPYNEFSDINWTTGGDNSVFDYYAGAEAASLTINLQAGDTWREQLTVGGSGSAAYPILIRSYGAGADPVISGADIEATWVVETAAIFKKAVGYDSGVVQEDGVALTFVAWDTDYATTAATMSQGSYTYDYGGSQIVYVWCTDDADPDTHTSIEVANRSYGIYADGKDYITIEGLQIEGSKRHGIFAWNCDNWDISDMVIFNIGGALAAGVSAYLGNGIEIGNGSSDFSISDSTIYAIFDTGISVQISSGDAAIADVTISDCITYECGMSGIDVLILTDSDGSSSSIADTIITGCSTYDNGEGFSGFRRGNGFEVYSAVDSTISGTIINRSDLYSNANDGVRIDRDAGIVTINRSSVRENLGRGISLSDTDDPTPTTVVVNNSLIYGNTEEGLWFTVATTNPLTLRNNVFYDNGLDGNTDYNVAIFSNPGDEIIKNNIFYGTDSIAFWTRWDLGAGAGQDYNLYYRAAGTMMTLSASGANDSYTQAQFATYQAAYTPDDINSVSADPLLTNPGSGDFTLQSGSPAIDAGVGIAGYGTKLCPGSTWPSGVITCPAGNQIDIGAYEYPIWGMP